MQRDRRRSPGGPRAGGYGGLTWQRGGYGRGGRGSAGRGGRRGDTRPDPEADSARDMRTVFVGQLAQKVRERDVFSFFERAGRVRDVRLIMDRNSTRHKGAGYVEFYARDSIPAALALSGQLICGFPLFVKPSVDDKLVDLAPVDPVNYTHAVPMPSPPPPALPPAGASTALASDSPAPALGWSMATRQPVRSIPASASGPPSVLPVSASRPMELVSIEELAILMNPNRLPVPPIPSRATQNASVNGAAVVPLPIAASTTAGLQQVPLPLGLRQVPLPVAGQGGVPAITKPAAVPFTRLYIGSVSFQLTEADLRAIFEPFGAIIALQLQREQGSGRSRGYGFVEYAEHESAKKALEINGLAVAGRSLKVALASQEGRTSATVLRPGLGSDLSAVPLPTAHGNQVADLGGMARTDIMGELDEGRDGGLVMNASQRALLMQRLSRGEDMGSVANGGKALQPLATTDTASNSLLLTNMFDAASEPSGFEQELAEDVRDECTSKYGSVAHLFVDKASTGFVYIKFADLEAASKAKLSLHGRWFGGKRIQAAFVSETTYNRRFPEAP